MKKTLLVALLALSGTGLSGLSAVRAQETPAKDQTIGYETLALGDRSGCARPAKMVISNQAEWQRVWRVAGFKDAVPTIDWTHQRVVALLSGASGVGGSVQLMRAVRSGAVVTVYVWSDGGAGPATTQPYHFAALPIAPDDKVQIRFAPASEMACPSCVGSAPASNAPGDVH